MAKSIRPKVGVEALYRGIKKVIDEARNTVYRSANFVMVHAYWDIGKLIVEEEQNGKHRAEYGEAVLETLSIRLSEEYGKNFSNRNLRYIRQFFISFPKRNALRSELSWTHYRLLLKVEKNDARDFYMQEAIDGNWNTRTIERQINSLYYERMLLTQKKGKGLVKAEAESKKETMLPVDIIKDPYVLEFLNLKPNTDFYEKELEQGLIDRLQDFLLELGKGFSFVSRQYRMTAEDEEFYIDLVFYNYILKCFLLIDLKAGKLTHQDVGQMDMYVRMFEEKVRQESDNPTIGLILCSEKNNAVVKYSLLKESKQIFTSKYQMYLPTEKQLQKEIERARDLVEMGKRLDKE